MTIVGIGRGSNSMKYYANSMLKRIRWGVLSKAPVAVAGLHSIGPLQPNDESKYTALSLTLATVLPMSVKAIIDLGIPDILANAEGGKPLSAQEILAKMPTKSTPGPLAVTNLRRLMRPLVQHGVFTETLNDEKQTAYGLTDISKWYVRDDKLSLAPYADLVFTRPIQSTFSHLHETVLNENANPFAVEHDGLHMHQYWKKHPQFAAIFENAMISLTRVDGDEVVDMLQDSGWLEGVKTFVDVGGGVAGSFVGKVVARNPHIQGINLDQPHVLERAPEVKGVRFVGGDFMKSVPSGDLMFMKYVAHNYNDEDCITILKKCFEALPKGGKMMVAEIFVKESDNSPKASLVVAMDLTMLGCLRGGRERTREECQQIMEAAGFSQFSVIESQTTMDLIIGIKQ